jgi:hypothetical protein
MRTTCKRNDEKSDLEKGIMKVRNIIDIFFLSHLRDSMNVLPITRVPEWHIEHVQGMLEAIGGWEYLA